MANSNGRPSGPGRLVWLFFLHALGGTAVFLVVVIVTVGLFILLTGINDGLPIHLPKPYLHLPASYIYALRFVESVVFYLELLLYLLYAGTLGLLFVRDLWRLWNES